MNLVPMAIATALFAIVGYLAGRRVENRGPAGCAMWLVLALVMWRGFYWNVFGRGEGFFTANRISAVAVFAVVLIGANGLGVRAALRERFNPNRID